MRAFLLCAGLASRFKENKLLIRLNHENCVQRQVRLLREEGIKDITVVVNQKTAFDIISTLDTDVKGITTGGEHKNAFLELQGIIQSIGEDDDCIIILGDVVCSKKTLSFMVKHEGDFNVYGLEHGNPKLIAQARIWGRPEVFAIKIRKRIIDLAKEQLAAIDPNYRDPKTGRGFYDWWKIPRQLHIPITPVEECLDIDYEGDIAHIKQFLQTVR